MIRGNVDIIFKFQVMTMYNTEQVGLKPNDEFWSNATKYSSWSNGEYEFLREISFILVSLRNSDICE